MIFVSFNEKLQSLRKANKLSQEQLADMLDVTRQSVSKWESGTTYPEMDKLITMCKIFSCSLDDLTNDEISEINVEKKDNANLMSSLIKSIRDIIQKSVSMFSSMSGKQIVGVLVSLLFLGILLSVIYIPFDILEENFYTIVVNLSNKKVVGFLMGLFNMVLDIVFLVLYLLAFIYIYKLAYLDKHDETVKEDVYEETNKMTQEQLASDREKVKIHADKTHEENKLFSILGNIVLVFLKFITGICMFPFIFILLALLIVSTIAIILVTDGILYLGVLLSLFFLIILTIWFLEMGSIFIFNRHASFTRLLWTFIIGIAGIGISIGVTTIELSDMTFINALPSEYESMSYDYEFPMQENLRVDSEIFYRNVKYVEDDTLENKVILTLDYYEDIANPTITEENGVLTLHLYYPEKINHNRKIWHLIKNDLKNKTIHDYSGLFDITITIKTSRENIDKLQKHNPLHEYYYNSIDAYLGRIEELESENEELKSIIRDLDDGFTSE